MIISRLKSRLDGNKVLFDFQTESSINNKFDLIINPQGQLNRVIGMDKLAQQILKYMLVLKGTYQNDLIGTDINNPVLARKNEHSLKTDIINSLSEYSKYQVENSKIETDILGWNIWRTQYPEDNDSWKKVNKYLIVNNFYYDEKDLNANEVYYYNVERIRNVNNRPVSDGLGTYLGVEIPVEDTLNAIVGNSFIVVPVYNAVTLYWKKGISYYREEMLRSVTKLTARFLPGEPRNLMIYAELTNLEKAKTSVTTTVR